jgi:hypothetical protein
MESHPHMACGHSASIADASPFTPNLRLLTGSRTHGMPPMAVPDQLTLATLVLGTWTSHFVRPESGPLRKTAHVEPSQRHSLKHQTTNGSRGTGSPLGECDF